jgi:chromosome segregation ATPase
MSKLLPWVLPLVLFASNVFAQNVTPSGGTITTSKSTLTLPPIEGLTSENSLRQALSIADIGLTESTADLAASERDETALKREIADYEQKQKDEQAQLDNLTARFEAGKKQYDERLAAYQARLSTHNSDAANQRAGVQASNSLPPERRDAGTVNQLNEWASRIAARKALLDQERDLVNAEREVVESKRLEAVNFREGATSRLTAILDPLKAKIATHNAKMGLAYRQLKQCADYAVEIRKMLKVKFNKEEVFSPALNGAMEQLKALSGRGFDTP